MAEEKKTEPQQTERFVVYNLKAKNVLFDTKKQEAVLEQETKEDLMIAMLLDIKNTVVKLEEGLI